MAFSIPYAFFSVVGLSLTAVIVPILAEYDAAGQREAGMRVASSTINIVALVSTVLAVAGIVFAPQIAAEMGRNFTPDTLRLASVLTALMMPSIVFMSIAGVAGGVLNNYKIFGGPAIGPVSMNAIIIFSTLASGWFGMKALVVGTLLGAISYVAFQLPGFFRIKFKYSFTISLTDPAIRRVARNVWSVMLLSGCYYIYTVIDFNLASGMPEGSITALNYATKFIQLPQGMFVIAVTTAIFPALSAHAAKGEMQRVGALLQRGLRAILVLSVPGTLMLLVLGHPLMSLLFQRGMFTEEAAALASGALAYLTIGLVGFSLNLPLIRGFYALHDQLTPLVVVIVSIAVKWGLSVILAGTMRQDGLALATSITYLINALAMILLLYRRLPALLDRTLTMFCGKLILTASIMLCAVYLADVGVLAFAAPSWAFLLGRLCVDGAVGGLVFLLLARIVKISEITEVINAAMSSLRQRRVPAE
jgi:putative peptidoglycan lipid II flippase